MTVLTEHIVLSLQETFDSTHQRTTLTSKVRSSLTLECSLKQITCTDTDTECNSLFLCLARCILVNSVRAVQTTTLAEHSAERSTRTLRCNHNNINILRWNYACAIAPVDSETM